MDPMVNQRNPVDMLLATPLLSLRGHRKTSFEQLARTLYVVDLVA